MHGLSTVPHRGAVAAASALAALGAAPDLVRAHGGSLTPDDLWGAWRWDLLPLLILLAGAYLHGVRSLRQRASSPTMYRWRAWAFAGGTATLGIALVSPLDALGGTLLSAHMTQHLALVLVAAPALALGAPAVPLLWALPQPYRSGLARWWSRNSVVGFTARVLWSPLTAGALHGVLLWTWHLPRLYEGSLNNDLLHAVEHLSLLGTALLFWQAIIFSGAMRNARAGAGIVACFVLSLTGALLGALMTFARTLWYASYDHHAAAWSVSALGDQQVAGLLMWGAGGMVYAVAGLACFWQLLARNGAAGGAVRPEETAATHPMDAGSKQRTRRHQRR